MVTPQINVVAALQLLSVPPIFLTNNSGQGLRVDWNIERDNGPDPDTATITVFNLSIQLRKALEAYQAVPSDLRVSLAIGWRGFNPLGGLPEVVFIGEAWEVQASKRERPDNLTIIEAGDGAKPLRDTPPSGGSAAALTFQLAVAKILGDWRIPPSPEALAQIAARAAALPIPTFQFTGEEDSRTIMNDLMASIGLTWGCQNGQFVVFQGGLLIGRPPVILGPLSGLLNHSVRDDGSVSFEALAQPRVVPGASVTFLNRFGIVIGGGPMRCERVQFEGSTMGPSLMRGIARKLQIF